MYNEVVNEIFEFFLDSVEDCVFYVAKLDSNPHHIYLSDGVESLLGYKKQDFYDDFSLFYSIIHEADKERVKNEILNSNYNTVVRFRIKNRRGEYLEVESQNYTKCINEIEYAFGFTKKIKE